MARKSMRSSRQHVIAFAAMLGLLVGGIAKTEAAEYTFTKIADSADFEGFCGPPAINDKGVVAFSATRRAGPGGIFTGTGDGTSWRTIAAEDNVTCSAFGRPSINESGVLAYRFSPGFGQGKIIRTDGSTPTTIAEIGTGGWTFLGHPSINDSDTVAFFGQDGNGSGIFTSDGTTLPRVIAQRIGVFAVPPFGEYPSLSDRGAVAFLVKDLTGPETGIFRSDGTTPIAHTSNPLFSEFGLPSPFLSLNDEGAVAFWARLDAGGDGIFLGNGTAPPTTIADRTGPFNSFDAPSLNDEGAVAFWASLDDGGHGIFTGPDPDAHKVIAAVLFDGSTVGFLWFGREGLNNAGQVAFRADFLNGRVGVYRADPVRSEPEVLKVSVDIKPGGNPNSINPKSQGTVPVAILGSVDFDATTVNPTTVSLAGAPVKLKKNGTPMAAYEDANGDGRVDLVVHVSTQDLVGTQDLQLGESSMVVVLTGQTYDGMTITGSDVVRIVP